MRRRMENALPEFRHGPYTVMTVQPLGPAMFSAGRQAPAGGACGRGGRGAFVGGCTAALAAGVLGGGAAAAEVPGGFEQRGYYLTFRRMPTYGLVAWKRTVDLFATDGINLLGLW